MACEILVPQPGIEPTFLHWRWFLNHWTTREVLSQKVLTDCTTFQTQRKKELMVSWGSIAGQRGTYLGTGKSPNGRWYTFFAQILLGKYILVWALSGSYWRTIWGFHFNQGPQDAPLWLLPGQSSYCKARHAPGALQESSLMKCSHTWPQHMSPYEGDLSYPVPHSTPQSLVSTNLETWAGNLIFLSLTFSPAEIGNNAS